MKILLININDNVTYQHCHTWTTIRKEIHIITEEYKMVVFDMLRTRSIKV